eukprot:GHVH01015623.1.p1 GENE.GHVH01015623.1~~GHVH01015623.1.p1  ORF type:complete len:664 (-),score=77.81 GHVH01015623.1:413-2404(-)
MLSKLHDADTLWTLRISWKMSSSHMAGETVKKRNSITTFIHKYSASDDSLAASRSSSEDGTHEKIVRLATGKPPQRDLEDSDDVNLSDTSSELSESEVMVQSLLSTKRTITESPQAFTVDPQHQSDHSGLEWTDKNDKVAYFIRLQALSSDQNVILKGCAYRTIITIPSANQMGVKYSHTIQTDISMALEDGVVGAHQEIVIPMTLLTDSMKYVGTAPTLMFELVKIEFEDSSNDEVVGCGLFKLPGQSSDLVCTKSYEVAFDITSLTLFLLMVPVTDLNTFVPENHWHSRYPLFASLGVCDETLNPGLSAVQFSKTFSMVDINDIMNSEMHPAEVVKLDVDRFSSYSVCRELHMAANHKTPIRITISMGAVERSINLPRLPLPDVHSRQVALLRRSLVFPLDYDHHIVARLDAGPHRFYGQVDMSPFASFFFDGGECDGKIDLFDKRKQLVGHLVVRAHFWSYKKQEKAALSSLRKIRMDFLSSLRGDPSSTYPASGVTQEVINASLNMEKCLVRSRQEFEDASVILHDAMLIYKDSTSQSDVFDLSSLSAIVESMNDSVKGTIQHLTGLYCSRILKRDVCHKFHGDILDMIEGRIQNQAGDLQMKIDQQATSDPVHQHFDLIDDFTNFMESFELTRRKLVTSRFQSPHLSGNVEGSSRAET